MFLDCSEIPLGAPKQFHSARVTKCVWVELRDPHALTQVLDDLPDAVVAHSAHLPLSGTLFKANDEEGFRRPGAR